MMRTLLLVLLLWAPAVTWAGSVYLNGTRIDGVRNQEFKNCTVKIDKNGNIHITAKGYSIKGRQKKEQKVPSVVDIGAPPTKRYFLVTKREGGPGVRYEVDVYVGAKWIRKLLNEEENIFLEITKYLKQGSNKIRLVARKQKGSEKAGSSDDYMRVIIGVGESEGREVVLNRKLLDYRRTGAETGDYTDVYDIIAY